MPDLATSFVDITTLLGGPRSDRNFTTSLDEAIRLINNLMSNPSLKGVIWFPPGVYLIETNRTIGANVTLSFAPGALLVPMVTSGVSLPERSIQIQGMIDAGVWQIFATAQTLPSELALRGDLGQFVMMGRSVPRILPEWWGAASSDHPQPEIDTAAIEASVQAAIVNRELLSGGTLLPPVTIYCGGTYQLSRGILIDRGDTTALLHAATFEGCSGPGGLSTFKAAAGATLRALLIFSGVQRIRLRRLAFDGLDRASVCLRIDFALWRNQQDYQVEMDGCSFINGSDGAITVVDDSPAAPARGSIGASARRCHFGGIAKEFIRKVPRPFSPNQPTMPLPDPLHPLGTEYVALAFSAAFSATLVVAGCVFDGFAWRAIRLAGGRSQVDGCHFEIVESPEVAFSMATDVALAQAPATTSRFASVAATACVSRSPSFLRVYAGTHLKSKAPTNKVSTSSPQVTLLGVVHRSRFIGPGIYQPPAVIWEESSLLVTDVVPPPPVAASLSLIGCDFGVSPELRPVPPPLRLYVNPVLVFIPRVYAGSRLNKIYNAGTFHEMADARRAFLVFDHPARARPSVRSLGEGGAVEGPRPVTFSPLFERLGGLDTWLLPFAWATWLWEEPPFRP